MLPTPAVLIERSRLMANLDRMQAAASARGVRLRPHTKTHKSPRIAGWQLERGAVGICCAKLGEAEVFADAGIKDIRLPYPLNPINASRVVALLDRTRLSFIVDHPAVAKGWSMALASVGREVDVLVKVDVGFHRCGIDPSAPDAVAFVEQVASLPGLRLKGLLAHAGHGYHATSAQHLEEIAASEARTLRELAEAVRRRGIAIDEISAGATPTARFALEQPGLTEYRPGNYVYFDRTQVGLGAATMDDCALTVLATVVSKPAAGRVILDSGSKTLSSDGARGFEPLQGYGVIFRGATLTTGTPPDTDLIIERLSEEHATVRSASGSTPLEPGHHVRVLPNHACVVSNLVDRVWLMDGERVIEALPVAARGQIQ
ncbi:MAG: alanine racemase [Acidobacteria bacterium]|nr:alanine racemase [Acidobacteriota bacterium]